MASDIFVSVGEVVDNAVSGGYVIAIALVCVLQYVLHLYRISGIKEQSELILKEMRGLEGELHVVQKERTLTHLENYILREFVSQTEPKRALDLLLRRFVPSKHDGFGIFLVFESGMPHVLHQRGLSEQSLESLEIDQYILDRLDREEAILLEGNELFNSRFLSKLDADDRRNIRELYFVSVRGVDESKHILVSTMLYPAGAPREQQIALAKRLMIGVAGNVQQSFNLEMHKHELQATKEMLELRSITDQVFEKPIQMIEVFVESFRNKVQADRIALFLTPQHSDKTPRALVSCGINLQSHVENRWMNFENQLSRIGLSLSESALYNKGELKQLKIDTLIENVLLIPLVQNNKTIGVMCISKQSSSDFTGSQRELATWACEYLTDSILKALSYAVVEREAREDPLTKLANRRVFDKLFSLELQNAQVAHTDCSLLMIDLDKFKLINDNLGHQAGDEVLRSVGQLLKEQTAEFRSSDRVILARYGGEELAVVLPGFGTEGTLRVAESIRAAIEQAEISFNGQKISVTCSIGAGTFPVHAQDKESLLALTDEALYNAKSSGRNRTCMVMQAATQHVN